MRITRAFRQAAKRSVSLLALEPDSATSPEEHLAVLKRAAAVVAERGRDDEGSPGAVVVRTCEGPALLVDGTTYDGHVHRLIDWLGTVPGIGDLTLTTPRQLPWPDFDERTGPQMVLWCASPVPWPLDPTVVRAVPVSWADQLAGWLANGAEQVRLDLIDQFCLEPSGVASVFRVATRAYCGGEAQVWAGLKPRARCAWVGGFRAMISLAVPVSPDDDLEACLAGLKDFAASLSPPPEYAAADLRVASDAANISAWRRREEDAAAPDALPFPGLFDVFAPDVYTWQLLGPGHLAKLTALDATPFSSDLWEVQVGEWSFDLIDPTTTDNPMTPARARQREAGKQLLGPILPSHDELWALLLKRLPPRRGSA